MSNGTTRYTVLPAAGMNTDSEYEAYRQLMDEHGLPHAPLRRVPQADGSVYLQKDATCLWDSSQDAQAFADELSGRTRTDWVVREYIVT